MNSEDFRKTGHELIDWMADYLDNIEKFPVKSQVKPKEIITQLPDSPPEKGEPFTAIFHDFNELIIPGITHWQHPSFFAYFPANSSRISVLAEMITATIGAQCMSWETSPAATELEERVMEWLRQMLGLPAGFTGVIQDTASTATLCSLLTAREKLTDYEVNRTGLSSKEKFTIYSSSEAHSSIEKAVKIAGFGKGNLRKIPVDDNFALIPEKLEETIKSDKKAGFQPLCVVAATGTTGSTAIDPLRPIGEICKKYQLWLHVDAALSGSALLLPEKRWMIDGIEYADSFVFNPHKWLFTNFDCSAYFVKDPGALIQTFEILPEYLKTEHGSRVNNYRDWGIQLGRRFRALKLWFVIRHYGITGLQDKIRFHIAMTEELAKKIQEHEDFELLAPVPVNTICFRFKPPDVDDLGQINTLNELILKRLNATGKVYLTHTKLKENYTIRFVIGQTEVQQRHVDEGWRLIQETASIVLNEHLNP
ncbi:MAG: pyridoxal phosphate-dependent decarboxylase family protein [Candidatus Odinarchaeota archaeon]